MLHNQVVLKVLIIINIRKWLPPSHSIFLCTSGGLVAFKAGLMVIYCFNYLALISNTILMHWMYVLLLIIIFCCHSFLNAQQLTAYRDESSRLWGYKNESEKTVIPPAFSEARAFAGGVAQVAVIKKERYWGLINEAGEYILKPTYNGMEPFCGGYAQVRHGDPGFDNNIRRGFIDMQGNEVVKPRFYHAENCISEDKWFKVQYRGGDWIYVNLQDKESKTPVITEYLGRPNKDFILTLSISENAVVITDRVTKKEKKVELPDKGEMTGATHVLNDFVTAIPCKSSANSANITHYYLLIPDKTGATFLKPTNGNSFYTALNYNNQTKACFTAGTDLYNHKGELTGTDANIDFKSNYYFLNYKPLNNTEKVAYYFSNGGTQLNLPAVKDLMVFQDGDYLSFIHDGMVQLLKIKTNDITQSYPTYNDVFFQKVLKYFGYQKVYDAIKKSNAIPILTDNRMWSYVGLSGGTYNIKVTADYVLPFFNNKHAPVSDHDKWGLINKKGIAIAACEFDSLDIGNYHLFKNSERYYVNAKDSVVPYKPAVASSPKPSTATNNDNNDPERSTSFCLQAIYYTPQRTDGITRIVIIAIVTTRQKNLSKPELMETVKDKVREKARTQYGTYFYTPGNKSEWIEPEVQIYQDPDKCMKMRESIKNGYEKGETMFIIY